ncbi:hypothetical protein [Pleurocapsa sp. PCC 7319]|uniref:hypothetical protein n=1 Tax=Pleurocapsa sp. PCC 7319 TaxID=118161 RepID=UPI001181B637|nr:hypothetical protein [Pleurocapsa sp. PCC 7319]
MNSSLPLRIALIANAVFSFTCAMLMIFNSSIVDQILGIQAPLVIQSINQGNQRVIARLIPKFC